MFDTSFSELRPASSPVDGAMSQNCHMPAESPAHHYIKHYSKTEWVYLQQFSVY